MDKLLEYIMKEWEIIKTAPGTFIMLLVLAFIGAFVIIKWGYESRLKNEESKYSLIEERLKFASEKLEECRAYSSKHRENLEELMEIEKDDLQARAFDFVTALRKFTEKHKAIDDKSQEIWSLATCSSNEQDRKMLFNKFNNELMRNTTLRNSDYNRNFKADAILLRDELRTRLKIKLEEANVKTFIYESPTNYFGFDDIATDLETMAKNL